MGMPITAACETLSWDGQGTETLVSFGRVSVMRLDRSLIAAALVLAATSSALGLDMAHVTCGALVTADNDDIEAVVIWLRGYHAGKTGDMATTDNAELQEYALDLGTYCKSHIDDLAVHASENILAGKHRETSEDHNQSAGLRNPKTGSEAAANRVEPTLAVAPTGSFHSRSRPAAPRQSRRISEPKRQASRREPHVQRGYVRHHSRWYAARVGGWGFTPLRNHSSWSSALTTGWSGGQFGPSPYSASK
jgi:HdeA/HdeB family